MPLRMLRFRKKGKKGFVHTRKPSEKKNRKAQPAQQIEKTNRAGNGTAFFGGDSPKTRNSLFNKTKQLHVPPQKGGLFANKEMREGRDMEKYAFVLAIKMLTEWKRKETQTKNCQPQGETKNKKNSNSRYAFIK